MAATHAHGMPKSKKDKTIPYTYEARTDLLHGQGTEPMDEHWFADTLCGLVALMADQGVAPADVRLYAVFQGEESQLDAVICTGDDGNWIAPPRLCHVLEEHYALTRDERYRGHVEEGDCRYIDRDKEGHGPY